VVEQGDLPLLGNQLQGWLGADERVAPGLVAVDDGLEQEGGGVPVVGADLSSGEENGAEG
jgi:hypothetical protein